MLKVRVIPTLLWKEVGLVKGIGFNSWRRTGSILPAVKVYNTRQVDELIVLDITAGIQGKDPDYNMVGDIAHECFVPLTVGGGVTNIEQIKTLLRLGADKVSINTGALHRPELITEAAMKFGNQCVVVSIDVLEANGGYFCASHSGTKTSNYSVIEWAQRAEELGAGEIILTDVVLDGSMKGYNLDIIRQVAEAVKIPVIASGGAGSLEHFSDAILNAKASAVAASSIFQFTEVTPLEVKNHLAQKGVPVRTV
jgi:cyclase